MSYNVIPTEKFKNESKRLIKKYPSLKSELEDLNKVLIGNPESGTSLGNKTYKIRLAIKSKGKGKSGGARIITYLIVENKEIHLLTIYDKAELDAFEEKILSKLIKDINNEY